MAAQPDDFALKTSNRDFGQLCGYAKQLRRYLGHRLSRPQDVEDVIQEVYLRLLEANQTELHKPLAYIYRIAWCAAVDYRRKGWHRHEFLSEGEEDWLEGIAEEIPDDLADRLNLQQQIVRALAQLPRMQAFVLLAHKHRGLSYEEVAAELGLSIHTVEKYVTQAKARIRTMTWER